MTSPIVRRAAADEAGALFALIEAHRAEGHLLPRSLDELERHAERFVVAEHEGRIVGCGEVLRLSADVGEVRSLVVDDAYRGNGVASRLVSALAESARHMGFESLCAFTHEPTFFVRQGFSIVPHVYLPEKIQADCVSCPLFRQCGQFAMLLALRPAAWCRPAMMRPAAAVAVTAA